MMKALESFKRKFLLGYGKENTLPENITTAQTVELTFVPVSFIEEQQFSPDLWGHMTKGELYLFVSNAQNATTQAARAYKTKTRED